MTKQDDAVANLENPLLLRSPANGGTTLRYSDADNNSLAVMRYAGIWAQRTYLRNEVVWNTGGHWVALADTVQGPGQDATEWAPLGGPSGYGTVKIDAPKVRAAPIDATWSDISDFDSSTAAQGCAFVPLSGDVTILWPGLWTANIRLAFEHDTSNDNRNTAIRVWNVTKGNQVGDAARIVISRTSDSTSVNVQTILPAAPWNVGDIVRWQVGSLDTIADLVMDAQTLTLLQIQAKL
jgi:hypothetical protein